MAREASGRQEMKVLLEEIQSDVRKIAEGHGTLAQGIARLETRLEHSIAESKRRLGWIEKAVMETNERLEQQTVNLGQLNTRFDVHERAHAS